MGGFDQVLWDQGTWGGPTPDPPDASIKVSDILTDLYPRLHAAGATDLIWWTAAEIVEYMTASLERLAQMAGVFVERSVATTVNGTAVYSLPVGHVSTIHVTYNGQPLRSASASELIALDPAYATTTGTVKRWYEDTIGLMSIGLQKVPDAANTLAIIHHAVLGELTSDGSIPVPDVIGTYLEDLALADCYGKQSDASMPETAVFLRTKAGIIEQALKQYYGEAQ